MTLDAPQTLLLVLLFLPAAAAVVVALLGPDRKDLVRWTCTIVAVAGLFLALALASQFMERQAARGDDAMAWLNAGRPTFKPVFVPGSTAEDPHRTGWNLVSFGQGSGIQFYVGVDGMNIWLVVLTALLLLPCVLVSWHQITDRVNEFYAWLLLLQTALFGIFLSFDILLFYVFFELSLVPLFFLIGIWGHAARVYAARKFFIYTLAGSLVTLLGLLGVVLSCYNHTSPKELTFSIPRLVELVHAHLVGRPDWATLQVWIFLAMAVGLAIKVPFVPLHTWLPLAHVEAPTAGSVILAGVLLKVGAYGFLRLAIPLTPDAALDVGLPLFSILGVIGVIYGSLCAFAQEDFKKLIAYSSVAHLGMCMMGMFALNMTGLQGSLVMMINHGLSSGALFLLAGMLYERYHTRKIAEYGGMAWRLPLLGFFMVFITLTSVGLPGLNGFIGEYLVLTGVWQQQWTHGQVPVYALLGASGVFFGAWYLFTLNRRVFFGPVHEPGVTPGHDGNGGHAIRDLDGRELVTMIPICVVCLLIGLYPKPMLDTSRDDVAIVEHIVKLARDRAPLSAVAAQPGTDEPLARN